MLQEFQRDSDELLLWMDEKFKVAEDESYRDPTNILRKLKRHEAAEREMKANEVRLDRLVQVNCCSLVPSPITEQKNSLHQWTLLRCRTVKTQCKSFVNMSSWGRI